MKPHSIGNLRAVLVTLCGIALATSMFATRAKADQWDKKTILTVDQPIQVRERLLQPGTYVFKLLNSESNRHVVEIFNQDQSHLIDTVMAITNYRLQPTGDSRFSFYETPAGTARALHAWFYPGDNFGQEFAYPKHNITLEASASAAPPAGPAPSAAAAAPATPAPAPDETPVMPPAQPAQPEPTAQETQPQPQAEPENRPVEMAQATPPPAPVSPPNTSTPSTLPTTGSPYPTIGLLGLLSLGLYGVARMVRQS